MSEEEGRKFDQDKPRWELLPLQEIEEIVEVLTSGAKKYDDDNWKHVMPRSRYIGALYRHLKSWRTGEKKDPQTGKSHLAHAGCDLLFLMWFDNNDNEEKNFLVTEKEEDEFTSSS
jgi:hypothetical protein